MTVTMLTHVMVGSDDVARSKVFYDAVLGALGVAPGTMGANHVYYVDANGPALGIGKPLDGKQAIPANGGTLGFSASSPAAVDAFHSAGLANSGTDEGAPGPRPQMPNSYGAYLRDPDGNKICAYSSIT